MKTGSLHFEHDIKEIVNKLTEMDELVFERIKKQTTSWPTQVRLVKQFPVQRFTSFWKRMKYPVPSSTYIERILKELKEVILQSKKSKKLFTTSIIESLAKHIEVYFSDISKPKTKAQLTQFITLFSRLRILSISFSILL